MSEEEKKAIEIIEIIVDECKLENKRKGYEGTYYDGDTPIPYKEYGIILNLITKLQKEIQDYKYLYEQALDNTMKADKENIQLKKQINLMAEYIANRDNDEDICKYQVAEWCEDEEDGVLIEVCRNCIKQYFERKVKNVKNKR